MSISDDEVVSGGSGDADEFVIELVDWGQDPGEDDAVYFFEFKKGVFCMDYSHAKVIGLNSVGHT